MIGDLMGEGVIDVPEIRGWVEQTGFRVYNEVEIFLPPATGGWTRASFSSKSSRPIARNLDPGDFKQENMKV